MFWGPARARNFEFPKAVCGFCLHLLYIPCISILTLSQIWKKKSCFLSHKSVLSKRRNGFRKENHFSLRFQLLLLFFFCCFAVYLESVSIPVSLLFMSLRFMLLIVVFQFFYFTTRSLAGRGLYIYIYNIQKPVSFYLCFFLIFLCVAYIKWKYELKFLSHSLNCNELDRTTQQKQADCRIFWPERSSQIAFVKQCKCAGRACNTLAWSTPSTGNCSVFWFALF